MVNQMVDNAYIILLLLSAVLALKVYLLIRKMKKIKNQIMREK